LGNILAFLPAVLNYALLTNRLAMIADDSLIGQFCRVVVCRIPLISQVRHWLFKSENSSTSDNNSDYEHYVDAGDFDRAVFSKQRYVHLLRRVHSLSLAEFDAVFSSSGLDRYVHWLGGRDLRDVAYGRQQHLHYDRPTVSVSGLDAQFNDWWFSWQVGATQVTNDSTDVQRCVAAYANCDEEQLIRGDVDCVEQSMYRLMFLHPLRNESDAAAKWATVGPVLRVARNDAFLSAWPSAPTTLVQLYALPAQQAGATASLAGRRSSSSSSNIGNPWLRDKLTALEEQQHQQFVRAAASAKAAHSFGHRNNNNVAPPRTVSFAYIQQQPPQQQQQQQQPPPPPPPIQRQQPNTEKNTSSRAADTLEEADTWLRDHTLSFPASLQQQMLSTAVPSAAVEPVRFEIGIHLRNQFDFFENEQSEADGAAFQEIRRFYGDGSRVLLFRSVLAQVLEHAKQWAASAATAAPTASSRCFAVFVAADTLSMKLLMRHYLLFGDLGGDEATGAESSREAMYLRHELFRVLKQGGSRCHFASAAAFEHVYARYDSTVVVNDEEDGDIHRRGNRSVGAAVDAHQLTNLLSMHIERHVTVSAAFDAPASTTTTTAVLSAADRERCELLAVALVDAGILTATSAFHVKAAERMVGRTEPVSPPPPPPSTSTAASSSHSPRELQGLWWPALDWFWLARSRHLLVWRRGHSRAQSTFAHAAHQLAMSTVRRREEHTARCLVQTRGGGGGGGASTLTAVPMYSASRDKYHYDCSTPPE
jgi:hypothetical protein